MRLLFDECVDERLRLAFTGHDCQTARFAKLAELKNGELISAAQTAGFDVLITADQNIPAQQNIAGRVIVFETCSHWCRLCYPHLGRFAPVK
jgi:predicted nuclease of predicted toxin-antitoxin system